MCELYIVITNIERNKQKSLYFVSIYSSTFIYVDMIDGEEKIRTPDDMFYSIFSCTWLSSWSAAA